MKDIKIKLMEIVEKNPYKGLLFSGGLDTSILACLNPNTTAITISLEGNSDDIPYAISLAEKLKMRHFHRIVRINEAIEAIPEVIKILMSFDPALPNDLVVYFGLKFAKDMGIDSVATGDGSDELFAGYSFMEKLDNLEFYIRRISERMSFSSNLLGKFFGIKIIQPFIDKTIIDYALKIHPDLKIREYKGRIWGKWILRKAFEELLPKENIWQEKRPLEFGSGMTRLRKIISCKVSDEEFRGNTSPIKFINKEHYYYYKIFRGVIGDVPKPKDAEVNCPGCGGGIKQGSIHCRICGYVLEKIKPKKYCFCY